MEKLTRKPYLLCLSLGLLLNMVIELLARGSFTSLISHVWLYPLFFLFNWLFVSATLCLSLFFKRKYFVFFILSVLWLILGFVNAYVLSYRVTPLSAIDFTILQISWNFIGVYVNGVQLVLIGLAIAAAVVLMTLVFRKAPKSPVKWKSAIAHTAVTAGVAALLMVSFVVFQMAESHLSDMKTSYDKYGFVYCFFRGAVERGIEEPEDYSTELITDQVEEIVEVGDKVPKVKPNVIMLQLESFFDVNLLNDVEYSENPLPYFTYLKENFTHGRLAVPTVGAGTANSEFEMITGMSMEFFGTGEYPYKTVLKSETCETAPFNFLELGYSTFAVHSNNATFYDRNEVFPRLGFQHFVSSEYMNDTAKNGTGWIKDRCLIPQIKKCLDSTENQDYIYTISVQGHGAYPQEKIENPAISIIDSDMEESLRNQVEYYVNQLKETDGFLMELTRQLKEFSEPTVVVIYGDHMPSLDFDSSDLIFGDLFETEYVLWSNYDLKRQEKNLEAYQLSAYVMERLGMNTGVVTKLHQEHSGDADYLELLQSLEYDMLYGEKVSFEDKSYNPTDLKMGVDEITITGLEGTEGIVAMGENFTAQSYIAVNGQRQETEFVSRHILKVPEGTLQTGDKVSVQQISDDGVVLSETGFLTHYGVPAGSE